jgi:hypothetical protein
MNIEMRSSASEAGMDVYFVFAVVAFVMIFGALLLLRRIDLAGTRVH